MKNSPIPPAPDAIRQYIGLFAENSYAVTTEKVVTKLIAAYPKNTILEDVLLKVTVINRLYSTNVFAVYPMAEHIVELNIDPSLEKAEPEIVNRIAELHMGNKTRHFYSFASKYCSWHALDRYPIYDSYVNIMLKAYREKDSFASFSNADLWNYPTFKNIVQQFRQFYSLQAFSFKELDKFLWMYGREYWEEKSDNRQ